MPPVMRMPDEEAWEHVNIPVCFNGLHDAALDDAMHASEVVGPIQSVRRQRQERNERHNRNAVREIRNQVRPGTMRPFFTMEEVTPGKLAYVKYLGFWHAILVTGTDPDRGVVKAVHFAWPGFFSRRVISEDDFTVNLGKQELWELFIPEDQRVAPDEAVRRARARVGQKGFNMFTNRSSHVVKECVALA